MSVLLLTGSTGFLGKIIKNDLTDHKIISIGRSDADIIANFVKEIPTLPASDIVIHAAGKAHSVPTNKIEEEQFFEVNVVGTINILKALEKALPKAFVFISSVSVYGLTEGMMITEDYPLLAKDPYGKSKIYAEKLVWEWCEKNNVICTILRLPLIAGANPPGNLKAMISGIKKGYYFNIAGGKAKKSIVIAEDVAKIIPIAANIGGLYNLTDRHHPSFLELSWLIAGQLDKSRPLNMPLWLADVLAKIGDLLGDKAPLNSIKLKKITSDLIFDDSKAQKLLRWKPQQVLKGFKIE